MLRNMHAGCDSVADTSYAADQVSIHAPTQGATKGAGYAALSVYVSIHAPTQGATSPKLGIISVILFQSTHPRRVRLFFLLKTLYTHSFNPRTHAGCDFASMSLYDYIIKFQSTHPRRVRLKERFSFWIYSGFNPRTHAGCDFQRICRAD